jgi:hypothetical protein
MGVPLFGREHVDRHRETDGEEGHDWQGTTVLLLTSTGRNSGAKRTTPLIYQRHRDDYLVLASNGGGDPPGCSIFKTIRSWPCRSRPTSTPPDGVATADEKPELWRIMTATGVPYDEFQAKADREIPSSSSRTRPSGRLTPPCQRAGHGRSRTARRAPGPCRKQSAYAQAVELGCFEREQPCEGHPSATSTERAMFPCRGRAGGPHLADGSLLRPRVCRGGRMPSERASITSGSPRFRRHAFRRWRSG